MIAALSSLLRKLHAVLLLLAACLFLSPQARAGLTFHLNFNHFTANDGTYYYAFECWSTTTNATAPQPPYGDYYILSPNTNEVSANFHYDSTNGWSWTGGGYSYVYDFSDVMNRLTNGNWTIYVTNLNSTNVTTYTFTVSAANFTTNNIPDVSVIYPANDSTITNRNPVFSWAGPTNYDSISVFAQNQDNSYNHGATLPATQTSWPAPATLPLGTNTFAPTYFKAANSTFVVSTPLDASSNAISEWDETATLSTSFSSQFSIPIPPPTVGFTNVMHYTFDNSGNTGQDSSTNHFDINCSSVWGTPVDTSTTNAVAGLAQQFFGNSSLTAGCSSAPTFDAWTNVFAGSFSVSAWINPSVISGNDSDQGFYYQDPAVVYCFDNGLQQGAIPIGLTGSKVAFCTVDLDGNQDTLHSATSITVGQYMHVVVTRDAATGLKQVFINGVLDASDFASTENLTANLGGSPYKSESIGGAPGNGYDGIVDDVQIYSGILTSNDVAYLYQNPGKLAVPTDFNAALDTTNLPWATSGASAWFVETNDTPGDASAAQSGVVTNSQSSTISVVVTGPGTISFRWKNNASGNLDLEFDIDGNYQDDITGFYDWAQDGPFNVPAGQHTLSWTAYADSDTSTNDAGFLDMVSYVQFLPPVISLNPFDQTNYPGYPVGLIAAVTNTNDTTITWQWYKVGFGPITNATSAFFSPTNSGTPSVAGQYYAIASNAVGTASTTVATVTFMNAPLPPDWSTAFKSSFEAQDASQKTLDFYFGPVVDGSGNIYVAAEFGGNMTVGSSNLDSGTGGDAAAIVKQTSTGTPLWAVGITNNGNGNATAHCVALAPGGGVYLSGYYYGTNWLGTNQLPAAPNGNIFVALFDQNGSNVWVKTFGGANGSFLINNTLVSDSAGNVTLTALFNSGPLSIGTNSYTVSGQDSILFQLDPTGSVRWAQRLPAEFAQYLATSGSAIYVSFGPSTSGGGTNAIVGNVTNSIDRSWALASVDDGTGQVNWIRGIGAPYGGGNGNPYATGSIDDVPRLAATASGVVAVGAAYGSNATFGSYTVNFGALRGEYFARFDTNGNAQAATTFGSITTTPMAAVADKHGDVYVDGIFDTYSYFGPDLIAAPRIQVNYPGDFSQAFLAKFDQNGNPLWARMAVSPALVNLQGIALAPDGVWASGTCLSTNEPYVPYYTAFGTNHVGSDEQVLGGIAGGGITIIFNFAGVLAKVTDVLPIQPITLQNLGRSGGNYQFAFTSTAGHTNQVQYTTNLVNAVWQPYTNIVGDGTLKTIVVPDNSPSQEFFRVLTQ